MADAVPVSKNQTITTEIIGMTHEGEGVGRVDGFTLFVQGALPGEVVRAKVIKVKKQYGYARLEGIVEPSADRVAAPCPIYRQCGGCQLQHMSYEAQLRWKRQHVIDSLERIGKLKVAGSMPGAATGADSESEGILVHPTIGMDEPWRYRNKAQVPLGMAIDVRAQGPGQGQAQGQDQVQHQRQGQAQAQRQDEAGRIIGGFYARGTHRIIDMQECLIQNPRNDEAVGIVKDLAGKLGLTAYNEESGRGLLRHVVVRTGYVTGETMVVLVTNGDKIPHADRLIAGIREALPQVASIVQNVNRRNTNVIFGDITKVLWGAEVIYDELDGIRFAISARSFYQVNPVQTVALYRKAVEYAGLTGNETIIDAYCGIGTISLFLARSAGQVYGVEIVPEAIEDARRNAELNGITNAQFAVGLSEEVIPRWKREGIVPDVIVVDPPRKGCDAALLDTIIQMRPRRVVYVSCNPSTLARDLAVLEQGGFRTVEAQPVDMFPHTSHVECTVLLKWKGASD